MENLVPNAPGGCFNFPASGVDGERGMSEGTRFAGDVLYGLGCLASSGSMVEFEIL
jgi:hypothetical protein